MAGKDDDIALSLPQPPPPAPARREAAIGEALRRFDGSSDGAPARPAPHHTTPSRMLRPQWGVLVAASLIAMIGLPVAWRSIGEQQGRPAAERASGETADRKTFDVAEQAADAPAASPEPPTVAAAPPPSPAPPVEMAARADPQRMAEPVPAPPPPAIVKSDEAAPPVLAARDAPQAKVVEGRSQSAMAGALRAPPVAMSAPPAPPPPPPPATAPAAPAAAKRGEALAEAEFGNIVVTSARRRGPAVPDRGDWNACTINDPRRSLAACKYLVDPAAKGVKGQAAAHLADGLALAWQGKTDRAIAAFDQAIALAPKSALAYLNRGLAYQRQGDDDRALADLDRAVRLAPNAARGYYNRSLLLRERGDIRRARADQARAVSLDADYQALVD